MTRQPSIARRAEALLGSAVVATSPVAGGDLSSATKLRLSNGTTALMKTLTQAPPGLFPCEADGLRALAAVGPDGVAVPEVLGVDGDCLILAWVEQGRPAAEHATTFGRRLAATHAAGAPRFGAENDGFLGRLPLLNQPTDTWAEFYAARRLLPYAKVARDRGALTADQADAVERVAARMPDLAPEEAPSLLHGDLWGGNVLWGTDGTSYLIDPAVYGGHREVDLAMLALFGLPHLPQALDAYQEAAPLAEGWEERVALYQLFPLLAHACLFGGGYGARAAKAAAHYL